MSIIRPIEKPAPVAMPLRYCCNYEAALPSASVLAVRIPTVLRCFALVFGCGSVVGQRHQPPQNIACDEAPVYDCARGMAFKPVAASLTGLLNYKQSLGPKIPREQRHKAGPCARRSGAVSIRALDVSGPGLLDPLHKTLPFWDGIAGVLSV